MKLKRLAVLFLASLMLAGCGGTAPGTEGNGPTKQEAKDEKIDDVYAYITKAAEKTAARERYEFTAVGFGIGTHYDTSGEQVEEVEHVYYNEYFYAAAGEIGYIAVTRQSSHEAESTTREFMVFNGSEDNTRYLETVGTLYSVPLNIAAHPRFADYVTPQSELKKSEDGLNYVEFCTTFGNLVEFSTGEIRGYNISKPVMMRFYVDADGFLCRMEYDTAAKEDGTGDVYTNSFSYTELSDGAIPQDVHGFSEHTESREFPAGRDNSTLTADMIIRTPLTLTAEDARKYAGSMAIGHYDGIALTSDGRVLHAGEDGHPDPAVVEGWSDVVCIDNEVGGAAAVTSDGRVLLSGFETESYENWDLTQFTDIKTVGIGRKTLYGLKNDGTVVATGEEAYVVSGWSGIKELSVGGDGSDIVVGLKHDGTVIAHGMDGVLDANNWTDITQISAGRYHVAGLKSDGTAVACGRTDDKQDKGDRAVSGWSDLVYVRAGNMVTYGLKNDGTLVACGIDHYNVLRVTEWEHIVGIYTGNICAVGLRADGSLITVGGSNYDELAFKTEGWNLIG